VAPPSAGLSVGVGLGSVEDVDGDAAVGALGLGSPGGVVHPTTTTRKATTAQVDGRSVVGCRRVMTTTLAGRRAYRLVGTSTRRKCDKTPPFSLTVPTSLSYVGPALIGGNRGRGAGKGR
jgi:hypothetical protein